MLDAWCGAQVRPDGVAAVLLKDLRQMRRVGRLHLRCNHLDVLREETPQGTRPVAQAGNFDIVGKKQ